MNQLVAVGIELGHTTSRGKIDVSNIIVLSSDSDEY